MSDKVYDLSQLEELAGGSEEFVHSMVDTFLEHTPGQLEEMKSAYQDQDWTQMGALAHKIKPNIDLFGIKSIHDEIRLIENKGKSGDVDSTMGQTVARVDEVLQEAFTQLKAYKN